MSMYRILAALSDPLRLLIVEKLSANERAVGELALALGRSQPTLSKALRVLRDAELVQVRRAGQLRYYSLRTDRFAELATWALEVARLDSRPSEKDE